MWKKTLLALLVANTAFANELSQTAPPDEQLKTHWLNVYQQEERARAKQRENFLQLELLLQTAEKQGKISPSLMRLAEKLQDEHYPLYPDAQWALLKAKLLSEEGKKPATVQQWIADFSVKFPDIAKRNKLEQRLFDVYFNASQFVELVAYAKKVEPQGVQNQCRVLAAEFQLLAEQSQLNPEVQGSHSGNYFANPLMQPLLKRFETIWLENETLPSECNGIAGYWRDQGLKTEEKIRAKAIKLFQQNSEKGLNELALNANQPTASWLQAVQNLLKKPSHLQHFALNQPLDPHNKQLVIQAFSRFVKTLPEQLESPNFSIYQDWATRWQLSEHEVREWKITFINRLFDNPDPIFQLWRDEQLKQLKVDHLTERRLRMALWQQTELNEWLSLLSEEGKAKAEWRYWLAKSDLTQNQSFLKALVQERGFYPMLAAHALNQPYSLKMPIVKPLTDLQKNHFKQPLARIAEFRQLERFSPAKTAWIELVRSAAFEEKIALADYAKSQGWWDLTVEATIQAKAWNYLPLRLPNAYADWFALHLENKPISQSFATAIARQESAWNTQARSHANAIGLMQLLPSTAATTAEQYKLPYQNERDLLVPFKNIMIGTAHLVELNKKYPNNRILIASAYNAGASRVEQWLARAGNKLPMDAFIASIPFYETRGYVQNVLAYDFYYQTLYGDKKPMPFTAEEQRIY